MVGIDSSTPPPLPSSTESLMHLASKSNEEIDQLIAGLSTEAEKITDAQVKQDTLENIAHLKTQLLETRDVLSAHFKSVEAQDPAPIPVETREHLQSLTESTLATLKEVAGTIGVDSPLLTEVDALAFWTAEFNTQLKQESLDATKELFQGNIKALETNIAELEAALDPKAEKPLDKETRGKLEDALAFFKGSLEKEKAGLKYLEENPERVEKQTEFVSQKTNEFMREEGIKGPGKFLAGIGKLLMMEVLYELAKVESENAQLEAEVGIQEMINSYDMSLVEAKLSYEKGMLEAKKHLTSAIVAGVQGMVQLGQAAHARSSMISTRKNVDKQIGAKLKEVQTAERSLDPSMKQTNIGTTTTTPTSQTHTVQQRTLKSPIRKTAVTREGAGGGAIQPGGNPQAHAAGAGAAGQRQQAKIDSVNTKRAELETMLASRDNMIAQQSYQQIQNMHIQTQVVDSAGKSIEQFMHFGFQTQIAEKERDLALTRGKKELFQTMQSAAREMKQESLRNSAEAAKKIAELMQASAVRWNQ